MKICFKFFLFNFLLLLGLVLGSGRAWGQVTLNTPSTGSWLYSPSGNVNFAWGAVSGATGVTQYRIQVSEPNSNPSDPFTFANASGFTVLSSIVEEDVAGTTNRNFTLPKGQSYAWSVRSGSPTTNFANRFYFILAQDPPTLVSPANSATNQPSSINFSWNAIVGQNVDAYRIQISTSSSFTTKDGLASPIVEDLGVGNVTSFTKTGLAPGTYYWTVRGGEWYYGRCFCNSS